MDEKLTRRGLMASAAAMPLAAAARNTVPIGMATTDFRDHTNESLAKELSGSGIRLIQLFFTQKDSNYWRYGGRSDLPGMTPERAREIAAIYRGAKISIHSMGVYTNLIHPDPAERKANLAYFEAMMKVGREMGVRAFISEAGHYIPEKHTTISFDLQDDVWHTTIATLKDLARIADTYDATVLLEPIYYSIFASAKRLRVFVEEVGSPRVRVNLDPANLLEVNDLEEMFTQLSRHIGAIHAKDRKLHVTRGVAAGEGDLDYSKLVKLAATRTPGIPLVLEYVGSKNYKQALAHLRATLQKAGLKEA